MKIFKKIVSNFNKRHILVIGDLFLDQYIRGSVSRISPEAPVPVVLQKGNPMYTPGGAANVANNLSSLGAKVTLVGRVGNDQEGKLLIKELKKRKINISGLFVDKKIPTALKTRIIAQHQQVVRVDREKVKISRDAQFTKDIKKFVTNHLNSIGAIILSDYGKGLIDEELVTFICSLAVEKKKIVTVDPKVEHFSYYSGVSAITPNRNEAENAIRNIKITHRSGRRLAIHSDKLLSDQDINLAGIQLIRYLNLQSLLITLGEEGMRLFEKGKKPVHINTVAKDVYDVTGAGDTVISVFTLGLTAGATKRQAADLANYAAGVVVGKMGAVTLTKQELLEATQ